MMKKLLTLVLSVMIAMSLAVPAFALAGPGDVIVVGPDGKMTVADPNASEGQDWEAWAEELKALVDQQHQEWLDEFEAGHPGMLAQFEANAYDYFAAEDTCWGSAEEYMEHYGMTEAEFVAEMVENQIHDLLREEAMQKLNQALRDQTKAAMGGVAGQLGVMINGRYIQFPDAAPEASNGRTMTPVRAIVEALGGEAGYAGNEVYCTVDGLTLTFTLGSSQVRVQRADGTSEVIVMDCAPYVSNDRTYVPVRFIGEALGYQVGWDGDYQTAVLTAPDAMAEKVDGRFTILNRVLANAALTTEEGMSRRTSLDGSMTATLFDTLNGDTVYTAQFTGETLLGSDALNSDLSLTMSDSLVELLAALAEEELPEELLAVLGQIELSYIVTAEGQVWVHSPMLDQYGGEDNIWIGMNGDAEEAAEIFTGSSAATMGEALIASLEPDSAYSWWYGMRLMEELEQVLGDDCFTTEDGVSVMAWDLSTLGEEYAELFQDLEFSLTIDEQGSVDLSCLIHTLSESLESPAIRVALEYSLTTDGTHMTVDCHIANVCRLELELSGSWEATGDQPMTQPPEGAAVVDYGVSPLI